MCSSKYIQFSGLQFFNFFSWISLDSYFILHQDELLWAKTVRLLLLKFVCGYSSGCTVIYLYEAGVICTTKQTLHSLYIRCYYKQISEAFYPGLNRNLNFLYAGLSFFTNTF